MLNVPGEAVVSILKRIVCAGRRIPRGVRWTVLALVVLTVAAGVPLACVLLAVSAWYWSRLGDPSIPRSRRVLRRASLSAAVAGVPAVAAGFSIIDPDVRPVAYATAWAIALVAILAAVGLAAADALASVAEFRRERRSLREERRRDLESTLAARASRGGPR